MYNYSALEFNSKPLLSLRAYFTEITKEGADAKYKHVLKRNYDNAKTRLNNLITFRKGYLRMGFNFMFYFTEGIF